MVYLKLQKDVGNSFIKQIYEQIRQLIFRGELKAGEKIPSTREMALYLNISRNTVIEAYEMLIAEGYLVTPRELEFLWHRVLYILINYR